MIRAWQWVEKRLWFAYFDAMRAVEEMPQMVASLRAEIESLKADLETQRRNR